MSNFKERIRALWKGMICWVRLDWKKLVDKWKPFYLFLRISHVWINGVLGIVLFFLYFLILCILYLFIFFLPIKSYIYATNLFPLCMVFGCYESSLKWLWFFFFNQMSSDSNGGLGTAPCVKSTRPSHFLGYELSHPKT